MHRHRLKRELSEQFISLGLNPLDVTEVILRALHEDSDDRGDITSIATISQEAHATLDFVSRAEGVVAGVPVAAAVFQVLGGSHMVITMEKKDGDHVRPGDTVLSLHGNARLLLQGERPALNLLSHLSGIATATHAWVAALDGTGAKVRDTRKTTPGLRFLEKYAVRCGGGVNHRMNLSDAALVKDNHVVAAGGVSQAFAAIKAKYPDVDVEVEVDSLDQLSEVIEAGADLVLLDNFTPQQLRQAVEFVNKRAQLEASGGLTLANAREVAESGVDFIAVGALTHSAPVLDIGADLREGDPDAAGH